MQHLIGTSRNGVEVFVDLIHSAGAKRISRKPHLLGLVSEAIASLTLTKDDILLEHDMKRPIGYSFVIETKDDDKVFYARQLRDDVYTRFVKNGKPVSTSCLTLRLTRSARGYDLTDVEIGPAAPPRPGSANENTESRPYWKNHALVMDNQSLQSQTVTKDCPY